MQSVYYKKLALSNTLLLALKKTISHTFALT